MSNLVKETFDMVELDSTCSHTVAGEVWFNVIVDALSD